MLEKARPKIEQTFLTIQPLCEHITTSIVQFLPFEVTWKNTKVRMEESSDQRIHGDEDLMQNPLIQNLQRVNAQHARNIVEELEGWKDVIRQELEDEVKRQYEASLEKER